jgi:hypothetical protein
MADTVQPDIPSHIVLMQKLSDVWDQPLQHLLEKCLTTYSVSFRHEMKMMTGLV